MAGMFATSEIAIVVTAKDQATQVVNKVGESLKKWAPLMRAGAIGIAGLGAALIKLGRDTDRLETANKTYLTSLEKMELATGKVLRPLSDMAPVLVTLGGLLMLLSWKAGRAAAAIAVETAAKGINVVVTKAAAAANISYTMSVTTLTAAVTALAIAVTAVTAVVAAGLLIWQGVERRKRDELKRTNDLIKDQSDLLSTELEKLKSDQEDSWQSMADSASDAYDAAVASARQYYGDVEEMDNSLMAQERRRYQAEIDAIDLKHRSAIDALNEELGLLDQSAEQETRSFQDAQDQQEIDRLKGLRSVAATMAERAKLTDDINEKESEMSRRHQEESVEDKRNAITAKITAEGKAADEEKAIAESTSNATIKSLNDAGLEAIASAKTLWDGVLSDIQKEKAVWLPYYEELKAKVQDYIDKYNDVNKVVHFHIQDLKDINAEYDKLLPKVNAMSIAGGVTTQAMIPAGRTLSYAEMQHLYKDDNSYANGMQRYTAAWLASMKGKVAMTPELANQLGDMPGFKMASGGSGIVTKPTAFIAGESGPEAFSFAPLGAGGTGGPTYVDNRRISIGSWLGDRQGIEELVDRLQPVMRTRERWGTGKARY